MSVSAFYSVCVCLGAHLRVPSSPYPLQGTTHELIHGEIQLDRWKTNSQEGFQTPGWVPNDAVGWAPLEMPGVSWTCPQHPPPIDSFEQVLELRPPTGFPLSTRLHHSRVVLTACIFGALLPPPA